MICQQVDCSQKPGTSVPVQFIEGEGYYHFDGNTTEVLCETCFKQHFPTELDWTKHIVQVEEGLSDAEFAELLDTLSEDELEERAEEDSENSDAMCYYSEAQKEG